MATRAFLRACKGSLVDSLSTGSFGSRGTGSIKHGLSSSAPGLSGAGSTVAPHSALRNGFSSSLMSSDMSRLFSASGLVQRSLSCSPGLGSIIAQPRCQSSSWLSQSSRSFSSASGVYPNMRLRFQKQRRNRGPMKGTTENHISFGKYGLEALEPAWITAKQITAGQLAIKRNMKGGKLFLRIFPHKPVSLRPAETRMGRGKGNVAFWVAGIRAGRILFEIDGVPESIARRAIAVAASKMPIKTRFVKSLG